MRMSEEERAERARLKTEIFSEIKERNSQKLEDENFDLFDEFLSHNIDFTDKHSDFVHVTAMYQTFVDFQKDSEGDDFVSPWSYGRFIRKVLSSGKPLNFFDVRDATKKGFYGVKIKEEI